MSSVKLIALIVLFALVLVIMVQNTEVVTLKFLAWELNLSRIVLILITTGAGFLAGFLLAKARAVKLPRSGR